MFLGNMFLFNRLMYLGVFSLSAKEKDVHPFGPRSFADSLAFEFSSSYPIASCTWCQILSYL